MRHIIKSMGYSMLLMLVVALLTSCATTAKFQQTMDSHLGLHIDELRQYYGYNFIERELPNGMHTFTWTWVERGVFPSYRTPTIIRTYKSDKGQQVYIIPGTYFPPEFYETSCEFTFIIDASGRAVTWRAHGNGCSSYSGPGEVLGPGGK